MTGRLNAEIWQLIATPLAIPEGPKRLGRAVWLYLACVRAANDRGIAIRARHRFADELGVAEADIDAWLQRLIDARLVELQSPSPFLVISLRSWPRSGVVAGDLKSAAAASRSTAAAAVAEAETAEKKNKNKSSRDGGPGEGSAILAEVRAVLGEADGADLAPVVANYPEATVRRALERVRSMPSRQIKKSRTALFRFLLKHSSDHPHDHPPDHHSHA